MKIAFLTINQGSNDVRALKMARSLKKNGHELYFFSRIAENFSSLDTDEGIHFVRKNLKHREPLKISEFKSFIFLVFRAFSLWLPKILKVFTKNKKVSGFLSLYFDYFRAIQGDVQDFQPDLIHCHDLYTLPAGVVLAEKLKCPVVYDAHELEIDRPIKRSCLQKVFINHLENFFARRASAVVTVSNDIAKVLEKKTKHSIHIIYNAPPCTEDPYRGTSLREICGLKEDEVLLIYVGKVAVGRDQGLEELVESLKFNSAYHLALVGPRGIEMDEKVFLHAKQCNVSSQLHFVDPVAPEKVISFIQGADVGVFALKNICKNWNFSMPNKLFEMSLANLPLAISPLKSATDFLKEYNLGLVFDEISPKEISKTVELLLNSRDHYLRTPKALTELKNKYSWESQEQTLLRLYRALL